MELVSLLCVMSIDFGDFKYSVLYFLCTSLQNKFVSYSMSAHSEIYGVTFPASTAIKFIKSFMHV